MPSQLTPSTVFTLALVGGTALLVGAATYQYRTEARKPVNLVMEDGAEVSAMRAQELRAMYSDVPPAISQFQVIADRNLFSPERKAWTPPPAEPDPPSDDPPPPPSLGPHRIKLYGTTIGPERQTALLFFEQFSSRHKHRVMEVGETVSDDGGRTKDLRYVLKSLEADKAVLEDVRGQEIVVGLYDHDRTAPMMEDVAIIRPESPQPAPVPAAQAGIPAPAVVDPIRRMEDIPRDPEERERLAKEGRLRRISTPFGPVYRPIEE